MGSTESRIYGKSILMSGEFGSMSDIVNELNTYMEPYELSPDEISKFTTSAIVAEKS